MNRRRALARGVLLLGLAGLAAATPLRAAAAGEDFEEARKAFRRDSKAGDAKARAHA